MNAEECRSQCRTFPGKLSDPAVKRQVRSYAGVENENRYWVMDACGRYSRSKKKGAFPSKKRACKSFGKWICYSMKIPSAFWIIGENLTITGVNTTATMLMSFTRMFSDGPDVSLQGSPTVSPMTAAL